MNAYATWKLFNDLSSNSVASSPGPSCFSMFQASHFSAWNIEKLVSRAWGQRYVAGYSMVLI